LANKLARPKQNAKPQVRPGVPCLIIVVGIVIVIMVLLVVVMKYAS
jgi:hypothetical protein